MAEHPAPSQYRHLWQSLHGSRSLHRMHRQTVDLVTPAGL